VRYAWDALRRRPGRTAATALGIGLALALVILLLALSAGITQSSANLAGSSGVDLLATSANTSLTASQFPPIADAHTIAGRMATADPNVATASPWLVSDLVFGNRSLYAAANASPGGSAIPSGWTPTGSGAVGWIPDANAGIEVPTLLQGPGFTIPGDPHFSGNYTGPATHEIELDQALATVLGVGIGDVVWVSAGSAPGPAALEGWYANATAFRVVGICGPFWLLPSALLAFGYLSEVQQVLGVSPAAPDPASLVLIHLRDESHVGADRALLESAFPGLTLFSVGDILSAVQGVVNLYQTFGTLIGAIGLVVAVLFTTTVLLMSVDDRSREIALLRAIGFGPVWIAQEVLSEALLLAALGLAVGIPLGYLGAVGVSGLLERLLAGLPAGFSFVSFDPNVIASSLAAVVALAVAAAIIPVIRALQLPVASELRAP
jgi:ABC-type lipoprotein release transport system permease subunit